MELQYLHVLRRQKACRLVFSVPPSGISPATSGSHFNDNVFVNRLQFPEVDNSDRQREDLSRLLDSDRP